MIDLRRHARRRFVDAQGGPTAIVLVAMLSVQLGASLARQLLPTVGPRGTTALRTTLASLILLALFRPWRPRLDRRLLRAVVPYGISLGAMNLLFYCALARIPLGIAVALEFTGPLTVALLASRRALDFVWAIAAAAGIALLVPLRASAHGVDLVGAAFALGAGACWAAYIIFGQRAGNAGHGGQATALGMTLAALLVLPFGAPAVVPFVGQPRVWLVALGIAVFSGALPYSLEMIALKRLRAKTFGILMSLEPALAALIGLVILGEHLAPAQWLAIGCIIVAAGGSSAGAHEPPAGIT
jgi:inner membrane transporter RhtA